MSDFWEIVFSNWTFWERVELRGYVDAWMAAEVKR